MPNGQAYTVVDAQGNVVAFDANDNSLGVVGKAPSSALWLLLIGAGVLFVMLRRPGTRKH